MPIFYCPKCEKENDIEWESLPISAGDTNIIECQHCEVEIDVGWEAEVFVRLEEGA
jgi:hypothetical protein